MYASREEIKVQIKHDFILGGGYFGVKRIGTTFGNPRKLP